MQSQGMKGCGKYATRHSRFSEPGGAQADHVQHRGLFTFAPCICSQISVLPDPYFGKT